VVRQLYISIVFNVMVVVVIVVIIIIIIPPYCCCSSSSYGSLAAFLVLSFPVFFPSHFLFLLLYINFLYTAICLHSSHTSFFHPFLSFPVAFFPQTSFPEFTLGFCC
jgi:hypothetical protein